MVVFFYKCWITDVVFTVLLFKDNTWSPIHLKTIEFTISYVTRSLNNANVNVNSDCIFPETSTSQQLQLDPCWILFWPLLCQSQRKYIFYFYPTLGVGLSIKEISRWLLFVVFVVWALPWKKSVMIAFLVDYFSVVTRQGLNQFNSSRLPKGCPCSFVLPAWAPQLPKAGPHSHSHPQINWYSSSIPPKKKKKAQEIRHFWCFTGSKGQESVRALGSKGGWKAAHSAQEQDLSLPDQLSCRALPRALKQPGSW